MMTERIGVGVLHHGVVIANALVRGTVVRKGVENTAKLLQKSDRHGWVL